MSYITKILMSNYIYTVVIVSICSYLIGCISPSYIITLKLKGADIRSFGSGNAGTTNTLRVMGKKVALFVFVVDFFKGFFAVLLTKNLFGFEFALISMIFVVLGHIYPIFMNFKGGKGVATSLGVLYCLFFREIFICSIFGLILLYIKRYVSLAALFTLFIVNFTIIFMENNFRYVAFTFFIFSIVSLKHTENIKRLINKNERKLFEK